jgi:hypothetical protein
VWKSKIYQDDFGLGQRSDDQTFSDDGNGRTPADDAPPFSSSLGQISGGSGAELGIGSGPSGHGSSSAINSHISDSAGANVNASSGAENCGATLDYGRVPSSWSSSLNPIGAPNLTWSGVGQTANTIGSFDDGGANSVAGGLASGAVTPDVGQGASKGDLASDKAQADSPAAVSHTTASTIAGGSTSTSTSTSSSTSTLSGGQQIGGGQQTGLIINVTYDSSCNSAPAAFKTDVAAVVSYFESHFNDPVTINLDVGYGEVGGSPLSGGAIGESSYYLDPYTYAQIKSALTSDAKSTSDTAALNSLPASDPTNGETFWLTPAQEKALGLIGSSSGADGYVGFNSGANVFDYNNSDGVTAGEYDFFGTVAHEISEVMGRELLTGNGLGGTSDYSLLDLFHYSGSGVRDFSGTTAGYFSIDGGATNLNSFNTSSSGDFGDWKGTTVDAFNAFGTPGAVSPISAADLTAMDILGWDAVQSGTAPTISSVAATAGDYKAGNTITLTLNMSAAVNVTGTPTLTLNDGGSATYTGGTGSSALTFTYTVGAGQNTSALAVTAVTGTITDTSGNALSTSNLPETFASVIIDTTAPTVSSVVASGTGITAGSGDLAPAAS